MSVIDLLTEVSVLFNEPKLLKYGELIGSLVVEVGFSALQRAEIAEITHRDTRSGASSSVSVLFNEPKLLKLYR